MKPETPKEVIEFNQNMPYPKNIEGIRQENCEICMGMDEKDVLRVNHIFRKTYTPFINFQPLSGNEAIKNGESEI